MAGRKLSETTTSGSGITEARLKMMECGIDAYSQRPLAGLLKFTDYRDVVAAVRGVRDYLDEVDAQKPSASLPAIALSAEKYVAAGVRRALEKQP